MKVHIVKATVFPVVMYGCESWTIKAERWRTDALNYGAREDSWESLGLQGDQIREINPEYSLEGLMLKLKLQYFGQLMWTADSLENTWEWLKAEEQGDRGWDGWMASLTQWTWTWANSKRWWGAGRPGVLQSLGLQRVGHDWANELNSFQPCN